MAQISYGRKAAKMPTPPQIKKWTAIIKDSSAGLVALVNAPNVLPAKVSGIISLSLGVIMVACSQIEKYTGTNPQQP